VHGSLGSETKGKVAKDPLLKWCALFGMGLMVAFVECRGEEGSRECETDGRFEARNISGVKEISGSKLMVG
jgi:hypothetical protein